MEQNPFKVIKASNLIDDDIVNYWVDILNSDTDQNSFITLLAPESPAPMIILGGKGSGKTHILRYYSYRVQKIRADKEGVTALKQIQEEQFISVYLELGNFGFKRFSGTEISKETWSEWYFYYLNILLAETFLEQIIDLMSISNINTFNTIYLERLINEHFFENHSVQVNTIHDLYKLLRSEHKAIDKKLSYIKTKLDKDFDGLHLLFDTRDHKFFDITHYVMMSINELKDVRVVFLIDQFEDLSKEQQVYINTIIRHPKHQETISLRVAGRLYALKTSDTFSDKEKVLNAEVEINYLENFMIDDKDSKKTHKDFSIRLCENRMKNVLHENITEERIESSLVEYDFQKTLAEIVRKYPNSRDRRYFIDLKKALVQYQLSLKLNLESIEVIIDNLSCQQDPMLEKSNIYLFFQAWAKNKNLIDASNEIKKSQEVFLSSKTTCLHTKSTLSHVKDDLKYQLLKQFDQPIYHCGFKSILNITQLNPRSFINILKFMHEHCEFAEEKLFSDKPVSCKVQNRAIREASEWFWDDAINDVEDNREIRTIKRLCAFFKEIRLSDKPSERTLISFAYDSDSINSESKILMESARDHSLIIEDKDGKKAKNKEGVMLKKFQVNPMLTVKWDLPSQVGGTIEFTEKEIDGLCLGDEEIWKEMKNKLIKPLNIPFNNLHDAHQQGILSLF